MVERLIKHWQLYSKVNNTNTNFKKIDWKEFLKNNSAFIKDFDFVKGTIHKLHKKCSFPIVYLQPIKFWTL